MGSMGNSLGGVKSLAGRGLLLALILTVPVVAGGWRANVAGETINPKYVERIKNGQTTKHEILLYFGEPKEIEKSPEGPVYIYKSFKDAPAMPFRPETRQINPQSDQLMVVDENKQIKKAPLKTEGKILKSSLTVRFKSDGVTVMSYEYKEF